MYYHFRSQEFDCYNAAEYHTQMERYYRFKTRVVAVVPRSIRGQLYALVCLQHEETEKNSLCELAFQCLRQFAGISVLVKRPPASPRRAARGGASPRRASRGGPLVSCIGLNTNNTQAAGPDKKLLEFGLRRAQGPDGGLSACRGGAAFLGGRRGGEQSSGAVRERDTLTQHNSTRAAVPRRAPSGVVRERYHAHPLTGRATPSSAASTARRTCSRASSSRTCRSPGRAGRRG